MKKSLLRRVVSSRTYFLSSLFLLLCLLLPARAQLPSGWTSTDIGSSSGPVTTYNSTTGAFTMTTTAAGLQTGLGMHDDIRYLYRSVTGDFELVARVASFTTTSGQGQVGMVLRTGVDPADPHGAGFFSLPYGSLTANRLWTHVHGPVMDGNIYYYNAQGDNASDRPSLNPPFWLKLVKIGNNFAAYWSLQGRDWLPFSGNTGGAFFATGTYNIGLFVTSFSSSGSATAVIDNVSFGPPTMKYKTSWVGATSAGMADGNPTNQVYSMWVKSDGSCYTNSVWHEVGTAGAIYKDGKLVHYFMGPGINGAWEGTVTGNATNIFYYNAVPSPAVYRTDFTTGGVYSNVPTALTFTGTALGQVRGLGASSSVIFVSDYEHSQVRAVNASTLTEITSAKLPISLPRCGPITFDGTNFWVIQAAVQPPSNLAFSFYTTRAPGLTPAILCYAPDGTLLKTISWDSPDAGMPTALAYQDLTGNGLTADDVLWVCDNGPHQYIRKYTNLTGTPTAGTPFGVDGGIWNGSNPGQLNDSAAGGDLRFYGPVGVGTDSYGNIYVACNGGSHFATDVRKFNSAGTLQWRVNGSIFVHATDFDPTSDGQQVYSPDKHFTMNYANTAPGSEWSYTGYTRDIRQNANEGRNHVSTAYQNSSGVKLARLGSGNNLYMYVSGQGEVGKSWLYYFNKETAVPYGTNGGDGTAPNTHRIWTDKNLNGVVETGEYTEAPPSAATNGTFRSFDVDSAGDIWMTYQGLLGSVAQGGIRRVIYQGTQTLTVTGNPVVPKYDLSLGNPAGYIDYPPPAPLFTVYNVNYDHTNVTASRPYGNDILYAVGQKADGNWALVRCDNWAANPENQYNPKSTWSATLTPQSDLTIMFPPPAEFYYNGLDVAGNKVFVGENYGPIHVFDAVTGNPVIQLTAGPELSGKGGWIDMSMGVNAFKRSTGEYLVTEEGAGVNACDVLYRWTPAADTSVSTAPTALTAIGQSRKIVLNWTGPFGAITSYKLYRGTSSGGETLYQSNLTGPAFTDLNVTPGTTYYYKVTAVNAAGESAQSNEACSAALSVGLEYVKTDVTTQGDWYTGSSPSPGNYVYGSDGYEICGHATSTPSPCYYTVTTAAPSPSPATTSTGVWAASTSDVRALRKPASSTDRIAAYRQRSDASAYAWSWTVDVGTGWHQVALYLLDWGLGGDHYAAPITRDTHQIKVYDMSSGTRGALLDYHWVGDFFTRGKYFVWNISGKVEIEISQAGYHYNTVSSGLFFDPVQTPAPTLGWWKLDETGSTTTAADSSGAGNHGYKNYGTWTAGAHTGFDGCLTFGGTGTTSMLSLSSFNPAGSPTLTYATWFKTSTTGVILGMWDAGVANYAPALYVGTDNKLHGAFYTGVMQNIKSAASVNDNTWHHAALTCDGAMQTLYLDGQIVGMLSAPVSTISTAAWYFRVGQGYTTSWPNAPDPYTYFNGQVDDLRLYNRVLTPPEIWKLKN